MPKSPVPPLEAGRVDVAGASVFHRFSRSAGETAPAVVHVHGFAISGTYLERTAALLTPQARNFIPDLPGTGRSDPPAGRRALDIEGLAEALAEYCDSIDVEHATFVGNSLGCPVILELASLRPDLLERAVLISPAGGPNNIPMRRALGQMTRDATREPMALFPIAVVDYARFGPMNSVRLFRAMTRYDTLRAVARLRVPTLLVIGSRDPLIRLDRIVAVFSAISNAAAVVIPGAHALNFSHPQDVAALIEQFLEGCVVDVATIPGARVIVG